jgi:3D (Asp-Asp-Asp) domain-containing protein
MRNDIKKSVLKLFFVLVFVTSCLLFEVPFLFLKKGDETALAEALIQDLPSNLEGKLAISEENSLIFSANPTNPDPKVVRKMNVVLTAYSSTILETDETPLITASGIGVKDGIVANNILPFGTKIRIPEVYGDKIFKVEDRMSCKSGNYHIDIWFPSYLEAKSFGAKRTYVEVLD